MKRIGVLLMSMFLLMCTGSCSSSNWDDERKFIIDPEKYPILGYWEDTGEYSDIRHGLVFKPDGIINSWEFTDSGQKRLSESYWGVFKLNDTGKLEIDQYPDLEVVDGLYYKIVELTANRLVIRVFGGFFGIPFEKGEDEVYRKVSWDY